MTAPTTTPQTEVNTALGQTQIDLQSVLDDLPGMVTATAAAQTTADAAIPKSVVTTAGDVIVATGNAAVTRLAAGTSGYALVSNGAGVAPSYQNLGSVAGGSFWTMAQTPASPDARDEEFNGTADTLPSGWTNISGTPGSNTIDPVATPATNYTWSVNNVRPSHFMMQAQDTTFRGIQKSVTLDTNTFVYARVHSAMDADDSVVAFAQTYLVLRDSVGGKEMYISVNETSAGATKGGLAWKEDGVYRAEYVPANLNDTWQVVPYLYVGILKVSSTYYAFVAGPDGHWHRFGASRTIAYTPNQVRIGSTSTTAGSYPTTVGWDYVRFKATATNIYTP